MVSMVLFSESDQTILGAENIKDLFGFTSEEVTGNHLSMLLAPTYKELCHQLVWECVVNKRPMLMEGKHKNESKVTMTMLVTEAQQEMSGQAVLIASIYSIHVEYGIISVSKSGNVIMMNSRAEKLFEKSLSELRDKHIKHLIPLLENEKLMVKGLQKQVAGIGANGKQLSLWASIENDSGIIGEIIHLKIEDLDPDNMEMEMAMELDSTMSIVDSSRYFAFSLLGYLNAELVGKDIHELIDPKDIDSKVNIPKQKDNSDDGTGSRKRQKTAPVPTVQFISSPTRVMVRNKSGYASPFNMHISPFNSRSDRFCIYLKPQAVGVSKPPEEVTRTLSEYSIQMQVDNGECGSYTSVFSAVKRGTGDPVVVKIINKKMVDAGQRQRAIKEFNIGKSLSHPNIIKFYDQVETENFLCTVMEFGNEGSMESYTSKRKKLTEEEAHRYFAHMVAGLGYLHDQKCVHGDIKLNNVVIRDGVAKLIDFDMSKRCDEADVDTPVLKRTTFCGTSLYIAPEMVLNKDYEGEKADIWSLGVALFVMVTGEYPFDSIAAALQQRLTIPSFVSASCAELIRGILTFDPRKRFTVQAIQTHPWVASAKVAGEIAGETSCESSCVPVI
eukprot:TRINITY_DN3109_c0_g1_i1.p1 TRINITY_DN3109_c0_g1~~TRINITY_DN3109_c0_g1_i1.p1  ORF type:complete len:613 (+),score=140.60 TRINITY_DN3109_c0_g1_i1:193-2031(+)